MMKPVMEWNQANLSSSNSAGTAPQSRVPGRDGVYGETIELLSSEDDDVSSDCTDSSLIISAEKKTSLRLLLTGKSMENSIARSQQVSTTQTNEVISFNGSNVRKAGANIATGNLEVADHQFRNATRGNYNANKNYDIASTTGISSQSANSTRKSNLNKDSISSAGGLYPQQRQQQQQQQKQILQLSQSQSSLFSSDENSSNFTEQCFSIPVHARLQVTPSLLRFWNNQPSTLFVKDELTNTTNSVSSSVQSNLDYEVQAILYDLRKKELERSRRLIKENYRRAINSWHKQFKSWQDNSINSSNSQTSNGTGRDQVTIEKVQGVTRLTIVGTFQSRKTNPSFRQNFAARSSAYAITSKVYTSQVASKPPMLGHPNRSISIPHFLPIASSVVSMLRQLHMVFPGGAHLDISNMSDTVESLERHLVYNIIIPYCGSIPFAWTWIPISRNVWTDDEEELRVMPYFGDQDFEGVDISGFKKVPGQLERDLHGEAEELTAMLLLDKYSESKAVFTALARALRVSIGEVNKTASDIKDAWWYRDVIIPMIAKRKANSQSSSKDPMFSAPEQDTQRLIDEWGSNPVLWNLRDRDIQVFDVDKDINRSYGVGVGLGILNLVDFPAMAANYRIVLCRRCFCFGCQEHSIDHPLPRIRRDPLPPFPCPVNNLVLPTDSIRRQRRSVSAQRKPGFMTLAEYQGARRNNTVSALRSVVARRILTSSMVSAPTAAQPTGKHPNATANGKSLFTRSNIMLVDAQEKKRPASLFTSVSNDTSKRQRLTEYTSSDSLLPTIANSVQQIQKESFVDSLYVDEDGSICWLDSRNNNTGELNLDPIPIGGDDNKLEANPWLRHGAALLSAKVSSRIAAYLEGTRQLIKNGTDTTASQCDEEKQEHALLSANWQYCTNELAAGAPAPSFSPWKSKLQVESVHLQEFVPEVVFFPRNVISSADNADELEWYLQDFQELPLFDPPLTDAELTLVYKGLLMFQKSPVKPMVRNRKRANFGESSQEGDESDEETDELRSLLEFIQCLIGTRTLDEIRHIVLQKTVIVALRHRSEQVESRQGKADCSPPFVWSDLDDIDATATTLKEIFDCLPAVEVDSEDTETKLNATRKPPIIGNSFKLSFQPCNHEGPCSTANECQCAINDIYCEKFCACGSNCRIRAMGCNCKKGCKTKICPCMAASRACDPDICGTCGASIPPWFRTDVCTFIQQGLHQTNRLIEDYQDGDEELSDEGNRTKYSRSSSNGSSNHKQNHNEFPQNLCANLPFSHCRKALVYTGRSDIHGWGGFAGERIERGDFIMEYKGEVISQDEADRRGIIYDKHRSSYIFEANMCECIDATRKGNKSRFFNHVRDEDANVMPKIMKIDGEHRIGLFAKTAIEPGQELTFNYGYSNLSAPDWAHQSTGTIGFHGWQSKRSKFQLSHKAKLKKNK